VTDTPRQRIRPAHGGRQLHGGWGDPRHDDRQSATTASRDVTRVYFDPAVLFASAAVSSDAADALDNLAETGHELILLTTAPVALPDGFPHLYVLDETALAVRCSVSPQVSTRGSIRYARGTIASPSAVITPDQSRTTRAVSRG